MGPRGARWCNSEVLKVYHSMNHENPPESSPLSSSHAIPGASKPSSGQSLLPASEWTKQLLTAPERKRIMPSF